MSTPALVLLPDAERLVVSHLLSCSLVGETPDGLLVDARPLIQSRVYSTRPNRAQYPLVTVRRWGGQPALRRPRDRDEAMIQLDCWGGSKNDARLVLDACIAALCDGLPGVNTLGVVSRVDALTFWDNPDATFEPAEAALDR